MEGPEKDQDTESLMSDLKKMLESGDPIQKKAAEQFMAFVRKDGPLLEKRERILSKYNISPEDKSELDELEKQRIQNGIEFNSGK